MPAIMGIDPGVHGGVAVLRADGAVMYLGPFRPEMTEGDLVQAVCKPLNDLQLISFHRAIFVEKVGGMPQDKRSPRRLAVFMKTVGLIRGAILASGEIIHDATPQIWQAKLECLSGGNKNVTKRRAQDLFPEWASRIGHATADALLIAEYGRRLLSRLVP